VIMKTKPIKYPRLKQLEIPVHETSHGYKYVKWEDINRQIKEAGLDGQRFGDLFGCQTQIMEGAYPYDVEAVLERMMSGKLTGTQAVMD